MLSWHGKLLTQLTPLFRGIFSQVLHRLYFSPKLHLSTPALRRFGSPSAAATALSVAAELTTPRVKPPTRTSSTDSATSTPSKEVVNSLTSRWRQSLTGTLNRREPSFRTRVQQIIGASEWVTPAELTQLTELTHQSEFWVSEFDEREFLDSVNVWAKKGRGGWGWKRGILRGDDVNRASSFFWAIVRIGLPLLQN